MSLMLRCRLSVRRPSVHAITIAIGILLGQPTAEAMTPFSAVCSDVEVHAYRSAKSVGSKWTADEHFGKPWRFVYHGGDTIEIDGTNAPVVAKSDSWIVAVDVGQNALTASVWSYAINAALREVVAAQVNTNASALGPGIKTRSVQMRCRFEP